ncbi:C4-dicarboxylate transporter [Rhodovulum sulfidophilum]|uniref:TRAP transporter substrate-binding protein n=1 Tax=Rhodovulum visakhapatnamense TaxID=364297 RepID=A0ABS1RDC0_9RHOB|nr:TRAP transporter substrate-binding protein [Rhodovulum visakhapatnamense]MBL3570173.1 TRAP transporter substrate-binding protein [Rhodovulum visakhapatnamense]MBL3577626.1 TRAP transporter substrate-binding protein [Rhodovulum visakhapatnamense]OLS43522.1 C4-dicarboxylate transporter [Rhodovulum sulfidophilum]
MKLTNLALCLALGTSVALPAFAQDITLKASHNANAEEPYGVGMRKMAEILEDKTGGKATIQVFDNAQLGDEMESIQGTQMGTVDIAVTSNEALANFVPDLTVFSLPFLFKDAEQMDRALSDPAVIAKAQDILGEKGFHLITFFSAGTRHIMTKTPIETMDDLAGLKIRTMQNPAHVDTFKAFGANPTPLAYTELYGALETGVVDGAEAANTNYYAKKFYEVSPDWAVIGWLELVAPVIMGEAEYRKLPEDVQAALDAAGKDAGQFQRQTYRDSDNARFKDLEAVGVTITHPDDSAFRAAAAPIQAEYVTTDAQKELFELLQAVE